MADEIRFDVMRCYGFWRVALGCVMADMIRFVNIRLDQISFVLADMMLFVSFCLDVIGSVAISSVQAD